VILRNVWCNDGIYILSDSTVQSFDPFIVSNLTTGVLSIERRVDFALHVLILKLFVVASFEIISIFSYKRA